MSIRSRAYRACTAIFLLAIVLLPAAANAQATGKTIRFTGTTVFHIVDGKVKEEIGEEGALTALQQLGLVPLK